LFVTAIGHKDDVSLLQKLADKAFITPFEFSQDCFECLIPRCKPMFYDFSKKTATETATYF